VEVRDEPGLCRAAGRLLRHVRPALLLITRGRDGLAAWPGPHGFRLPAWGSREAVDPTGAGDAVVAAATLALAAGATPLECAALANVAGSVAVSRRGTLPVAAAELLDALARGGRP
jgi:D-beta-D-heptose 7-phosphate kinase/D-beta-D-heptose 1-phosphate adenosyltransferase